MLLFWRSFFGVKLQNRAEIRLKRLEIVVPRIVLFEIKRLLESGDSWRRSRGKRALRELEELLCLVKDTPIDIKIEGWVPPWNVNNVLRDELILDFVSRKGPNVLFLTNDENLFKEAQIMGISCKLARREIMPPIEKQLFEYLKLKEGCASWEDIKEEFVKELGEGKLNQLREIIKELVKSDTLIKIENPEKNSKFSGNATYCKATLYHVLFDTYSLREGVLYDFLTKRYDYESFTVKALEAISNEFTKCIGGEVTNSFILIRLIVPTHVLIWLSLKGDDASLEELRLLDSYPHIKLDFSRTSNGSASYIQWIRNAPEYELNVFSLLRGLDVLRDTKNFVIVLSHPRLVEVARNLGFRDKQLIILKR